MDVLTRTESIRAEESEAYWLVRISECTGSILTRLASYACFQIPRKYYWQLLYEVDATKIIISTWKENEWEGKWMWCTLEKIPSKRMCATSRSKVLSMKPNPSSVRRKTLFGRGMDGLGRKERDPERDRSFIPSFSGQAIQLSTILTPLPLLDSTHTYRLHWRTWDRHTQLRWSLLTAVDFLCAQVLQGRDYPNRDCRLREHFLYYMNCVK